MKLNPTLPRQKQHSTMRLLDKKLGVKFKEETSKVLNFCIIALCGAATWTVPKLDQNCLERFEMWCCRRIEVIIWTDLLNNEDILQRIVEK